MVAITCAAILLSLSMRGRMMLHTEGPLHLWYHLALFILLGALAIRSSTKPPVRVGLLICLAMLGLGIEYMEALRYGGSLEWYDVRTDTAGVAIGAILGWLLSRRATK
jgi:hypothetical protein